MSANPSGGFLQYHEPDIISILILISFFVLLVISEWLSDKVFRAGLIGQLIVGLIYGVPIANILAVEWQETFMALGYIGLILIIFEGGLTIRLDLLQQNLVLSAIAALIGVLTPIALSFALFYAGFGHAALEAFIVGVALCSTSLGTTFVVINSASKTVGFSQTRIGTVLISAAILDDVCGLVLVSVIHQLRDIADSGANLGWIIGRPILASGLMAILTPISAMFVVRPVYRLPMATQIIAKADHVANIVLMALVLCAFLAIAAYAGASVLFGAFLAGTFLSSLPYKHEHEDRDREQGLGMASFLDTFAKYLGDAQRFILQPLFFASIGFAIPFLELWTGEVIWKGIVFTLTMVFSKFIVGLTVPVWDLVTVKAGTKTEKASAGAHHGVVASSWPPATLLGTAMVARGEIGLLIIQIGFNETSYLSQKAFVIAVWAIVLNTIIGPVSVGFLVKRIGTTIAKDPRWGIQNIGSKDPGTDIALGDNLGNERSPEEGRAA